MTDTLRQRVDALIADSRATGYGSELPPSVARVLQALADAFGGTAPATAVAGPDPAIAPLQAAVADLQTSLAAVSATIAKPLPVDPSLAVLKAQFAGLKSEVDALLKALSGAASSATPAA